MMEIMGLHLPGAAFVNPEHAAARRADPRGGAAGARASPRSATTTRPIGAVVDERAIVNGIVGLLATGGSTNHTIHLAPSRARRASRSTWDDFADLSEVVPLLARVYPNGTADVNHFQAAGGMAFLIRELLDAGLLHGDVDDGLGHGPRRLRARAVPRRRRRWSWREAPAKARDESVLAPASQAVLAGGRAAS